jgi:hypothetical protein
VDGKQDREVHQGGQDKRDRTSPEPLIDASPGPSLAVTFSPRDTRQPGPRVDSQYGSAARQVRGLTDRLPQH